MTLETVAASFAVQPVALAKHSYLSAPNATSPTDFINQVYHQLFNHDADAAGLQYWTQQLAAAHGNPQAIGQFIVNVISGHRRGRHGTQRQDRRAAQRRSRDTQHQHAPGGDSAFDARRACQ